MFLFGVQLPAQTVISQYIPVTVLLKTLYDDIFFVMFMNDECDNCEISILTGITGVAVNFTSCEICAAQGWFSEKPRHIAVDTMTPSKYTLTKFYILLTVHLDVMLVNNQLDALFSKCIYFYFTPLHVSSSKCSSSGGTVCINTPSGTTYSSG